jgi:hypothetical protein
VTLVGATGVPNELFLSYLYVSSSTLDDWELPLVPLGFLSPPTIMLISNLN